MMRDNLLLLTLFLGPIWFASGIFIGLWIHRSSGEIEQRARRNAIPFVDGIVNGIKRERARGK